MRSHRSSLSTRPLLRRSWRPAGAVLAATAVGLGTFTGIPAHAEDQPSGNAQAATQNLQKKQEADPNANGFDQFIVNYKDSSANTDQFQKDALDKVNEETGAGADVVRETMDDNFVVSTDKDLKGDDASKFMSKLNDDPNVESVEPDAWMTVADEGDSGYDKHNEHNDTDYPSLWGINGTNGMHVPEAWDQTEGKGAVVAVVDTGITSHPDLNANVLPGYDFISDGSQARDGNGRDSDPSDEGDWDQGECGGNGSNSSWHGTHVAGTIAAVGNNNEGVTGVADQAKVEPLRVLGRCGGRVSDIADAVAWAAGADIQGVPANPNKADVVNLSLGGSGQCSDYYQKAVNYATEHGTAVVAAAGNESQDASQSDPANCDNTIAVAASDSEGNMAPYSNYGSTVDVTAPGGDTRQEHGGILSTLNDGTTTPGSPTYAEYQGTSMATPHVAGVVALMKSKDKSLTPAKIEETLKKDARPMPGECPNGCGAGLVDAAATLNDVAGNPGNGGGDEDPAPAPEPTDDETEAPAPEPTEGEGDNPAPEPTDGATTPADQGNYDPNAPASHRWDWMLG